MDFLNSQIEKDEHIKKIIADTEEIIKNFKQISSIIIDNIENNKQKTYTSLGKRLVCYNETQENSCENQIK